MEWRAEGRGDDATVRDNQNSEAKPVRKSKGESISSGRMIMRIEKSTRRQKPIQTT